MCPSEASLCKHENFKHDGENSQIQTSFPPSFAAHCQLRKIHDWTRQVFPTSFVSTPCGPGLPSCVILSPQNFILLPSKLVLSCSSQSLVAAIFGMGGWGGGEGVAKK